MEFIKLYKSLHLPLFLFERDKSWKSLVKVIFSILRDKSIELNPGGRRIKQEVLDYIREKTELLTISEPFKFSIVQIQDPKSKKTMICWQIDVIKKEEGPIHIDQCLIITDQCIIQINHILFWRILIILYTRFC